MDRSRRGRIARRRRRRMAAVEHDLSDAQWQVLTLAWGGCAYCGVSGVALQRDCVLPISRGGRYTATNIAPACGSCNASKCNDEVTGWLRRKRLDEKGFLARHVRIAAALRAGDDAAAVTAALLDEPGEVRQSPPEQSPPEQSPPEQNPAEQTPGGQPASTA